MTLKLVLIQFDRVLLPHFWFIRGKMEKEKSESKGIQQSGENHTSS